VPDKLAEALEVDRAVGFERRDDCGQNLAQHAISLLRVPLTIRDAQPADGEAISSLLGQLGYETAPSSVAPRLERLVIVGDRVVVAVSEGEVVGLAHLHASPTIEHERPAAKISALVVDESHRGTGIGRALVEAMEAEARARRCVLLFLTTAARREDAHAFYRRLGLEETGTRFTKTLD
jgi:GNAT superfamily N-acetyltransferase